jgi:hypothetical protein
MPEDAFLNLMPVDFASRAIVALAEKGPNGNGNIYHLAGPEPLPTERLVSVLQSRGYELSACAYEAWRRKLETFKDGSVQEAVRALAGVSKLDGKRTMPADKGPISFTARMDCRLTMEILEDLSMSCPTAGDALLNSYISNLEKSGLLMRPREKKPKEEGSARCI